jgi:hypothetical protein
MGARTPPEGAGTEGLVVVAQVTAQVELLFDVSRHDAPADDIPADDEVNDATQG